MSLEDEVHDDDGRGRRPDRGPGDAAGFHSC